MSDKDPTSKEILKDTLAFQCWSIFDYFMSASYQGAKDEYSPCLLNGMFDILKEMGRPGEKDA